MKILILTPQLPYPPIQGTSLRNFNIIRGLAQNHEITLLTFVESDDQPFGPLIDLCEEIVTVPEPPGRTIGLRLWQMVSTRHPDMAHRLASFSFDVMLDDLLRENQFDIVQIEAIELAQSIQLIKEISPDSKIVFDNHNAESALQASALQTDMRNPKRWGAAAYSWVQVRRLRKFEAWACTQADWVTVVSSADKSSIKVLTHSDDRITSIPNTIDVGEHEQAAEIIEFDMVYMGKMDYRPNIDAVLWFADEMFPLIRQQHPNATFAIVGQKPHARLDRLREIPGITITGRVDEVAPYIHGAKVHVMPLRMGSGTRLKLIQTLAAGKPLVSTQVGYEGFPVEDGVHLVSADTAPDFAVAVSTLLSHPDQATALGANGNAFAQQYDWRVVVPKFEEIYLKISNNQ